MLAPLGNTDRGGIRYEERIAPLVSLATILDDVLADTGFQVTRIGAWERFTTREGEHAALLALHGTLDGRPAQRDLGVVLLDDSYASISGYCLAVDAFARFTATVRELTVGDTHFLGVRRRRFMYTAPAGWQARSQGLNAEWFPLEYPRIAESLTVWAALPRAQVSVGDLLASMRAEEPNMRVLAEPRAITTAHGLAGYELVVEQRHIAILHDDRYLYPLRLESAEPASELWRDVIDSVRPVPRPSGTVAPVVHSLSHWVQ